jgi:hypothetical protein
MPHRRRTGCVLSVLASVTSRATIFRWIARYKEFHDEHTLD